MKEYKKMLESKIKVRFQDCDPLQHLNNSKYIDYIISAREDQLIENYDLDIYKMMQEKGVGWVAAQTQISYLRPATPMEIVTIQTSLISFSEKSLQVEGIMWNSDMSSAKAIMWAKLVHFEMTTQKSIPHASELMQLFAAVLNPLPIDFETRVKTFRSRSVQTS